VARLIDRRAVRGPHRNNQPDPQLVTAVTEIIGALEKLQNTRHMLVGRAQARSDDEHGPAAVPMPQRAAFNRPVVAIKAIAPSGTTIIGQRRHSCALSRYPSAA
jgi:hypothetical protein